jgi:glucose-6-phosphate dehydrogenase assembly protein OpcA
VAHALTLVNASIREIERELGRLRDAATDADRAPTLRTSAMTHVAWVPARWEEAAVETLSGLAERHPSRTILLLPRPEDPEDRIDADVDLRCFAHGGREEGVCFEVIVLRLRGAVSRAPASVVMPLLVSDLPVFLRWRGPLGFGTPELDQLLSVANRLLVDSVEWADPDADLPALGEIFERAAVSDIAWSRTRPWRQAVAGLWPEIAEARKVRVDGPRAEALLLAGWLRGRLGRAIELEHEPAGEIEAVSVDGREARPAFLDRLSSSDLLSEQLDVFGRDPIYEEAVRSSGSGTT